MANIDQSVFRWILETAAPSKSLFKRNMLKKFLLSKKRPKHCREEIVRQVVNALPLSKSVNIHLIKCYVKYICRDGFVILAEPNLRRPTTNSYNKQTLQNTSPAINKSLSASTPVLSSTCQQTNPCALGGVVDEFSKDIRYNSTSQAFASSIKPATSNDVARVKLPVLESRKPAIELLMNISVSKATRAGPENLAVSQLTSNTDVRASNLKVKVNVKKLNPNSDADIGTVPFHICNTRYCFYNESSPGEFWLSIVSVVIV